MNNILPTIRYYLMPLFNTKASGVYILLFAVAIGVATFIENDFGTSAAQKVIFQAWWFELLLGLFGVSIIVNIVKFRMVPQKKWPLLLFHSAIIVILIGAGITRYWGFEGMMHIRENDQSNRFLSSETHLIFQAQKGEQKYDFTEPVLFASVGNNHFQESYLIGEELIEVNVKQFIPNPTAVLFSSMEGKPILKLVIAGANGREEYFLEYGETKRIRNVVYNFSPKPYPDGINLLYQNDSLLIRANRPLSQMVMASQERDTLAAFQAHPLRLRSLYSDGVNNFVFGEFHPNGKLRIESEHPKVKNESTTALVIEVSLNGQQQETMVYGSKGMPGRPEVLTFNDLRFSIAYGAREVRLPFSIKLYDFIMEKYPGTNSASSYASEVQLIDPRNGFKTDYRIYMNNILNYDGYRFFQSSFDRDEKGTYLSVNHDYWGSLISYLGYALLTIGMILTFFSKKTRFYQVRKRINQLRAKSATFILLLLGVGAGTLVAQTDPSAAYRDHAVSAEHAQAFSEVVVQDFKGRMKPIHTLSREVLRKIARTERMYDLNADQILLSLLANPRGWQAVPLIKLGKHPKLSQQLGVSESYASFADFFTEKGEYKLRNDVRRVHSLEPIDRGVYEKELLKVDERLNILSMAFSGSLLAVIPNPDDPNNTWISNQTHQHGHSHDHQAHSHYEGVAEKFFQAYGAALREAVGGKGYSQANALLEELEDFQQKHGGTIMPSSSKIKGEILLNQSNVFGRLTGVYMLLGLAFLFFLFWSVFYPNVRLAKPYWVLFSLVAVGFSLHTLGLGLRWYVSGRAPWSNGYESMIYIAWTTTLAGVLFTRKSFGGLAATMVLAGTILFVATLSFLDPQITPLVPVLRSYWLTIHVSLEAGSYGFLMLGAIIGLINLILIAFLRESNRDRVKRIVQEMTYLSELTLIAGLFMISVGTYLGGVWANESWGRYWGWDAKETWALVTILVYAFILHMRIIPKLFGLFSYNLATIFGMASVIMTYYGVNYYLSGLHSYAAGDPVPIPSWVYVAVVVVAAISGLAYWRKRKVGGIS
ncbi:MAG: cytochrome c biogenesis protein CcsA [Bacteroidota bacterium]